MISVTSRTLALVALLAAPALPAWAAQAFDPAREFAEECHYVAEDLAATDEACQLPADPPKPPDPKPEDPPKRPPWHIGDPPPAPSGDPRPNPDPLKKRKYEEWLKKLGLGDCSLNVYPTDQDLQRSGPTPPGQEKDPTAVSMPTITPGAKKGCECKVAIESGWLNDFLNPKANAASARALAIEDDRLRADEEKKKPPTLDEKVAHEICHCGQANRGNLPWRDPNGNIVPTTGPGGNVVAVPTITPEREKELEDDASACSSALNGGKLPGGLSGPAQPR